MGDEHLRYKFHWVTITLARWCIALEIMAYIPTMPDQEALNNSTGRNTSSRGTYILPLGLRDVEGGYDTRYGK